jgi:hypothetical protein
MEADRPDLWPEAVPMWLAPAKPAPQPAPIQQPADDAKDKL